MDNKITSNEKALARFPPSILSNGKDAMLHNREVWKDGYKHGSSESQSRIADLERDCRMYMQAHSEMADLLTSSEDTNKTLMGLLEKEVKLGLKDPFWL